MNSTLEKVIMELTTLYTYPSPTYKTPQSDTASTGKLYPKLTAYLKLKGGREIYLCSSCQYRTKTNFKQSLLNRYFFAPGSKLIIEKA